MASPLQQQSVRRKLIYTGLILVLFGVTTFGVRGLELQGAPAPTWTVTGRANGLGLRQRSQGEVELTGSAIRLLLTGSRGFAVCALWNTAMDTQKKHQWNELELIVRSLTKLQPHFITPWLFQSWNLAYNVAVESDLVKDKYFYISRGIELLAEGERQNRDHPDLRFSMGFYNQHKIGLSDESNTFRCLYQLSSMDPHERDPKWLRTRDDSNRFVVIPERFEQFCQRHPMLVRRLREVLRCDTPEKVVDFLQENYDVPSRYQDVPINLEAQEPQRSPLKPALAQFPILPPPFDSEERELSQDDPLEDRDSNYTVSRAWYAYSLKPMPPPDPLPRMITPNPDPTKYRLPRYIAQHIFRGYTARAQTFIGETYEKDGWFDGEGWLIRDWFKDDKFSGTGREARVGDGAAWSRDAWAKAFLMWQRHGIGNGLYKTPEEIRNLDEQAERYRAAYDLLPGNLGPPPAAPKNSEDIVKGYEANDQLYWYDRNRQMTNFAHFYFRAQVEADEKTVAARKGLFEAEKLRKQGRREQAMEVYRDALTQWRSILAENADFAEDSMVQEESFESAWRYLEIADDVYGRRVKPLLVLQDLIVNGYTRPPLVPVWLPTAQISRTVQVPFKGPLDGLDKRGYPLIRPETRSRIFQRLGIPMPQPAPPPVDPNAPGGDPDRPQVRVQEIPK